MQAERIGYGAAVLVVLSLWIGAGPVLGQGALSQSCAPFEGTWYGTIKDEKIIQVFLGPTWDPRINKSLTFHDDHRQLQVVAGQGGYSVTWNQVATENQEAQNIRETVRVGSDADGYCRNMRAQSRLSAAIPGLRLDITGSYGGGGSQYTYKTQMCCFRLQPKQAQCAAFTSYKVNGKAWYTASWQVTMTKPEEDCDPGPAQDEPLGTGRPPGSFDPGPWETPSGPGSPPQTQPPDGESGF